jgi:hypothetical protein
MTRKRKVLLWVYLSLVVACLVPYALWCFGTELPPEFSFAVGVRALLLIPSVPLILALGFHPNPVAVAVFTPIYVACLFWPLPVFALWPESFQRGWVQKIAAIYTAAFLFGSASILYLICRIGGAWL